MRRRFVFALMTALFAACCAASALAAEPPKSVTLPNGMTIMVIEDNRFPLVAERLFVHAGSGYETAKQAGLSHLLEHMVFKSTEKRPAGQVASDIEGAGGELNASTSFDSTVFRVDLPADRWKLGLDVIKDMIFGAKFDPTELDSERQVVLSELARGKDSPDNRLFQMTQAMAWPGQAYGWPIIGFPETVSGFSAEDLRQYVHERYQPRAMQLVVVGKVRVEDVVEQAKTLFGGMENDRLLTPPAPYALPQGPLPEPQVKVEYGPWNKVRLQIAFPTPGLRAADEAGLEVLAQLLAGDETSRLYRTFKYDKKLVDDISCSSLTLERAGLFLVSATLDAGNVQAFWQGLLTEFSHLRGSSFTDHELERVRLNLEDGLYQAKETLPGLAMKAGFFHFYGYDPDGEANYLRAVRLVDQKALSAVIEAYLRPAHMLTAALVPKDAEAAVTAKGLADTAAKAWPAPRTTTAAAPGQGGAQPATPEVVDLGGGHRLVLLPDATLPYVSVSLVYNGGDALLPKDKQGLAELAANSLTTGTAKLSANALEDFLADRAASLSADSGRDSFTVASKFPSRFQKDLYGLIGDVLLAPAFLKTEVAREVADQLAEIKDKEDQPMALAFRKLFPFLFADTPYAYTRLGEAATVGGFAAKDVAAFWAGQRAMPWVMAVSGDFDAAAVRSLADKLAKAAGPAKPFAFPTPKWGEKREASVTLAGRKQSHLFMVFPVPGLAASETPGLALLNEVLAGQSGLLFSRLRDGESLGYSVTSFLWQSDTTGFLAFYIGTTPDKDAAALEGFKRIAGDLGQVALPDELMLRAKNVMTGDYYRERQSLAARSGEAAKSLSLGLPLEHEKQVVEAAQSLTGENLRALAQKYLRPEAAYVFKVEP
ncbi:pitrilysin family protein [Solidesulfovibrio sp.]|jgi:zinc protease|uniref:M16 family metallopeptidase n=1 Tax=Solidesulfovibrio sp. TaxID=2910990 RepID=UPI002B20AE2B|nr:pitrilysin family protein [Solidesulfovibrio sp.]MEA5089128.1 pitrilysin family protein [Solidesulfovibrio sp.]